MSGQHIQASAIFQYDIISFTLHNRECSKAVYAGNGCSRTGNQCTARVLGDISRFTTGVHLQLSFLIDGGMRGTSSFLNHLPAVTVYNSARRCTAVVHILVPPIQRGIQCVTMYSLVAAGINHSGICRSFSSHNLATVFIDGGAYGIPANKLPGITVFCIRSPFHPGINNGIRCHCTGLDDLPALIINDGSCGYRPLMHPLFATIQRGVHCPSLKALSASGTDNRV
ncbi:hypothetical protein BvCmsNSP058_00765 [Escherichia coli]|nr:hypothetical protein BvCmsNSP058_00765 [Escherichia coli]